jgi:predicted O-linked N-acetylglucosamine transferase (SPINDLY family)
MTMPPESAMNRVPFPAVTTDGEAAALRALCVLRREIAEAWLQLPEAELQAHLAGRLGRLHRMVYRSGIAAEPASPADAAWIAALQATLAAEARPAPGALLAALLWLAPHELPRLADPADLPDWLAPEYIAHLLASPPMFDRAGAADTYRRFMADGVGRLRDFVAADPHGEAGHRVARQFADAARFHALYFSPANVRDIFRARAELLELLQGAQEPDLDWRFAPRPSTARLKLGVLAFNFSAQAETFATLPLYRHLDRERFDVTLFALRQKGDAMETCCARHAGRFVCLPPDPAAQVNVLREADLDILYIGTNVTASAHALTRLALYRLARVQVAGVCACVTTGMRNVDCYLSGALSEPPAAQAQAHYTEKLYTIEGPAHCYDFGDAAPLPPAQPWPREAAGIPRDAVVFASGANFYKILPEVEAIWLRILASVPDSRLLLYPFNPQWNNEYPVEPFMRRLADGLRRHDIDPARVIVFNTARERGEVLQRLTLADIYLDSFPFSGATSLLDPLLLGLPAVVMDGDAFRSRVGPAIMRSLGLDELIACDTAAYISLAVRLAANRARRAELAAKTAAAMRGNPVIFDGRRHAAQAGRAFERMWQDYCAGRLQER